MRRPKRGDQYLSYSELLRAVGQYVERANLAEIRILETDENLILQGLVTRGEHEGERETYELTPEDINALLADGYAQRGKKI